MKNIVHSVTGGVTDIYMKFGLPYQETENTSLNQKLNILADIQPNTYPTVRYIAIGQGGHMCKTGAQGIPSSAFHQHRTTDNSPFIMIPFVLRELDVDLTAAERNGYALRRVEEHNGKTYAAYYLRRINFSGVKVETYKVIEDSGTTTTTLYTPGVETLNPLPEDLSNVGNNVLAAEYIHTRAQVVIPFNEFDAAEIINVANVLYDNPEMAVISEICLVEGVDKVIEIVTSNGKVNFNEVIGSHVYAMLNRKIEFNSSSDKAAIEIDFGSKEPIFNITNK